MQSLGLKKKAHNPVTMEEYFDDDDRQQCTPFQRERQGSASSSKLQVSNRFVGLFHARNSPCSAATVTQIITKQ